ncbi:MAG: sulfite exporter TauE/SafE family protein [Treponema sp.]|jgi:sulfite exporter TauE/SafE/copper chaperone CopZ/plastocyanin domain-containing protein|nr:sulfite exporter TauE/SafE family protein [Treponema sp.]
MQVNLKPVSFRIGGMTCVNCQNRIEKQLMSTAGIAEAAVNFNTGSAAVVYDASILTVDRITAVVEGLGYRILDGRGRNSGAAEIAGTLAIILALYVLLRGLGIGALASAFPLAEAGMGYGMLFVIGLITSVHCIVMCGGINLSQCIPGAAAIPAAEDRRRMLSPAIFYNAGRVVSYTAAGVLAGALGSVVSVSGRFQGLVQLAAGAFMVIMGINMLGFFPALRRFNFRLPRFLARKIDNQKNAGKSPLFIGLLNGLMPCGPLQAMQLYALSTGNPLAGGISMFLFSMGTVPLMFGLGAFSSLLSRGAGRPALTRRITQAGAVLITVMGMTMFGYGFNLSGFNFSGFSFDAVRGVMAAIRSPAINRGGAPAAVPSPVENGVQVINSTLSGGRYPAITVQAGIPVRWIIDAPAGSINGCNNRMIIREYGIEHSFRPGENIVEFTPARTGRFPYSCWMGMIRSSITVVEQDPERIADSGSGSGGPIGRGSPAPSPAGAVIPTDQIALAELRGDGSQALSINLRDGGIEPAVLVMQRGIPAAWTINNDSLDPGNGRLIFPAYFVRLDMAPGDNIIQLTPVEDFDFSTADNVFYGYVKVVDDLGNVDIEAVRAEVLEHETLIYPEAYFETVY